MSPATHQSLEHFAANIHWGAFGNPDDLDRFLDFVLAAYQNGDHSIPFDSFSVVIDTHAQTIPAAQEKQFIQKKIAFTMMLFDNYKSGIKLLGKFALTHKQ